MTQIIIFTLGLVAGGIVVWLAMGKPEGKSESRSGFRSLQRRAGKSGMTREKEENKRRILEFFASRDKISNDEIQTLLDVSDATATRYLDELEKEGKVRQVGQTGRFVYYQKM